MLYPIITVDEIFKTGWIGDDIQLQPKIKITQMENNPYDIKMTWYDRHGLPNPDNADQVLSHRMKLEIERQQQRENDLWDKVSQNFKCNVEVVEGENDKFGPWVEDVTPQCVTNFGELKIGFK